ncbi:hypothetical protein Brsp05_03458 [Brucella sp. NBRC 12953]|uniref:RES family NAD+ phosphorylase n=1 Tax=Brucella sp. NBRC 12953 TaxID=3075481 RepID=UPI0030961338
MISSPPSPFPASNSHGREAGTQYHRVHNQKFNSRSFNPGLGRQSRFAPIFIGETPIPTQYLATGYECAVHETIFHDVPFDEPTKTVGVDNIKPLAHSIVELKRDLNLVPLFAPDLAKWNLSRADLIDTTASHYHVTAEWALAVHQNRTDADGLIWTSKRCDPQLALMLFGDRVSEDDFIAIKTVDIYTNVSEMRDIHTFAERVDITLVL